MSAGYNPYIEAVNRLAHRIKTDPPDEGKIFREIQTQDKANKAQQRLYMGIGSDTDETLVENWKEKQMKELPNILHHKQGFPMDIAKNISRMKTEMDEADNIKRAKEILKEQDRKEDYMGGWNPPASF